MNLFELRNRHGERLDFAFHEGSREKVVVILGHGVTGNKDRPLLVAIAEGLSRRGWPCIRFSYSGNGESEGRFEESNISKEVDDLADVIAVVPEDVKIVYCGHSMGGAVGMIAAAEDSRIRALITLAGMVYTANFVEREFDDVVPGEGLMWDEPECPLSQSYIDDLQSIGDTLDSIAAIEVPWLLIHGTADDVIPVLDSEDAYATATCVKHLVEIEGASHVFDEESYGRIVDEIDVWLAEHIGA